MIELPKLPFEEVALDSFAKDFGKELTEKGACFPLMAIWAQRKME